MTELKEQSQLFGKKEGRSFSPYFASAYFLTVGILYLWGYWLPFNINILEYMGLADVLRYTVLPIASAIFIYGFVFAASGLMSFRKTLPYGGGKETVIGQKLNELVQKGFLSHPLHAVLVLCIVAFLIFGPDEKWYGLPLLIAFPAQLFLMKHGFLESKFLNDDSRSTIILLLCLMPMWAFGYGRTHAHNILDGRVYQYVTSSIDGIAVVDNSENPDLRIKYLGRAGDSIFLLQPDKTVSIVQAGSVKVLRLKFCDWCDYVNKPTVLSSLKNSNAEIPATKKP